MIYRACVKIMEVISMVAILLILVFTLYEVVAREIFGKPTIWTNELTSYMLVWFGMLSILYAQEKNAHVSVNLIYSKLSVRTQQALDLVNMFMTLIFAVFICVYGYKYWWLGYSRGWRHFGILDIPMSYTRIAMPIAGALLFLIVSKSIYEKIFEKKEG
ncbi:MAG TPA: TRAP transporter small permease [Desulfobacteraceae bacterium]|nr:TRAP transporter small permease [Desulfobacteraceae bacterium]